MLRSCALLVLSAIGAQAQTAAELGGTVRDASGGRVAGVAVAVTKVDTHSVRNTVTDWQHKRNRRRFEVYINKHKKEPPSRPDNWVN